MNLEFVRPLIKFIPEIRLPKRHIPLKEKLIWSTAILTLFFIMGNIRPIGVSTIDLPVSYRQFQMIFASSMGSLVSVGISPIVTASIVLQLLVGSKMLDIDLSSADGKALFQGTQKILTIIIALFESSAIVMGFHLGEKYLNSIGRQWALNRPDSAIRNIPDSNGFSNPHVSGRDSFQMGHRLRDRSVHSCRRITTNNQRNIRLPRTHRPRTLQRTDWAYPKCLK